jgi:hypothetical protein
MRSLVALTAALLLTLGGCASTRQERAAAFQQELPQLVTACNAAFSYVGGPPDRDINACTQLSVRKSLGLTDPATVRAYQRYSSNKTQGAAARDSAQRGTYAVSIPLPQVQ